MRLLLYTLPLFLISLYANDSMEQLYMKNGCNSCHGIYAEGIGATPRLQGQRENVLIRRLNDLKKGKTRTAFGTIMISFAKTLTDKQIIEMSKYLSTLKTKVNSERYEIEFDPSGDGGS